MSCFTTKKVDKLTKPGEELNWKLMCVCVCPDWVLL